MKGQTYFILLIIFTIIISVFSVLNVSEVEVNYLFWSGSSPLIFVILASVLLGGILTTIIGSKRYISLHKENKELKEMLEETRVNANYEQVDDKHLEDTLDTADSRYTEIIDEENNK